MAWNDGLTGLPLVIAQTTDTPLRVMAGPGTGKTYAMMRRLMRFLEEGAASRRIFVVTFTRTAAADLVKEIGKLGTEGCEDICASTLHSYCYGVLNRQHVLHITGRVPRPLVTFSHRGILQFEASPLLEDISREGKRGHSTIPGHGRPGKAECPRLCASKGRLRSSGHFGAQMCA